jgi:predicted RNA-binding protein (virulence factor B family)
MKIYDHLSSESPYKKNEKVHGIVYNVNPKIGYFVAVDGRYHGLILNKEIFGFATVGDMIEARVKRVRPDGKLELGMRDAAYVEIESVDRKILDCLKQHEGQLSLQ